MLTTTTHQSVLGAIRTYPVKSFIYIGLLPFAATAIGVYGTMGTIFVMLKIISQFVEQTDLPFLEVMLMCGFIVHFVALNLVLLYGNRLLFYRFADTSYRVRFKLFGLHLLSIAILPTVASYIFVHAKNFQDYEFLIIYFSIWSTGFYLLALLPSLLFIRCILGDEG